MAIPTNPILISDIIAEATSIENEDFMLIEQIGTHKKISGSSFQSSGSSLWTKNLDDSLIYVDDVVTIGSQFTNSGQQYALWLTTQFEAVQKNEQIRLQASAGNSNQLLIKSNAAPTFAYGASSSGARWQEQWQNADGGHLRISSGNINILMRKTPQSFFMYSFPAADPVDTGRLYKTGNVVKISL